MTETRTNIDDGGPAYPVTFEGGQNNGEQPYFSEGLTKREAFAMAAMGGFATANPSAFLGLNPEAAKYVAQASVMMADALLAALRGDANG